MGFSPTAFNREAFATGITAGDYRFDLISHERIEDIANNTVEEWFVIDAFYQGSPLNWNPSSNRETWIFSGKLAQDVYENQGTEETPNWVLVSTKRGADFRSTLPFKVWQRAEAARLGVRIGQIPADTVESATAAIKAVMKTLDMDRVIEELTGRTLIVVNR